MMMDYKRAILEQFLSRIPEQWGYDMVIDALEDDSKSPNLVIWNPYKSWPTKDLARHIKSIVFAVKVTTKQ